MTPEVQRPQRSGLSTKILVFVFSTTFAIALLVSGLAVHTLYSQLSAAGSRDLTRVAEDAAEQIARLPDPGLPGAGSPQLQSRTLKEQLEASRSAMVRQLLLLGPDGTVRASASRDGVSPPTRLDAPGQAGDLDSYRDANGSWVVSITVPVGNSGFQLAAEAFFQEVFAPVLASFSRLFVVDVCLVLLVSFLAYRITSAAVRPIERLSEAARHIAQGQFDHVIPEPASDDEVGLLARTFNDMMRRLRGYQSEIEAANRSLMERNNELKQAKETFEQLSITDGLTKLHNHRFFQDHLTREIKRVSRSDEPLSILLVDIDDFKSLNDRFGHAAGDELLMGLARIMSDTVRESDLLARYGGEEFVVLAANTDIEGAYQLAEKIRTNIAENSFIVDESMRPMRVTVSIGVAAYRGNRRTFFQAADRALYQAKAEGKNCVTTEPEDPA